MRIYGVQLVFVGEQEGYHYYRTESLKSGFEYRENHKKDVEVKKGNEWIEISSKIEH